MVIAATNAIAIVAPPAFAFAFAFAPPLGAAAAFPRGDLGRVVLGECLGEFFGEVSLPPLPSAVAAEP